MRRKRSSPTSSSSGGLEFGRGRLLLRISFAADFLVFALDAAYFCAASPVRDVSRYAISHAPGLSGIPEFGHCSKRGHQSILRELFGKSDVAHHPGQTRDELGRFDPPDCLNGAVCIGSGHSLPITPPFIASQAQAGALLLLTFARVCLRAQLCLFLSKLGSRAVRKSSGANTCRISISKSSAHGIGAALDPLDRFLLGLHLPDPEARNQLLGFGERGRRSRCACLRKTCTRAPLELAWSPSPASITPAFTSSSLNFPIVCQELLVGQYSRL